MSAMRGPALSAGSAIAPESAAAVVDLPLWARRQVAAWLLGVIAGLFLLAGVGGWVRLTRSGLSIVEWEVVTGIVPPIGERRWREAFAAYRETPEYHHVHRDMTLAEFRSIYLREWLHRLLGRVVGLAYVVPLVVFLVRGAIPLRRAGPYVLVALGFALQGAIGWYMVKSGLVDRPFVSPYRLAAHLLTASFILFLCLRMWLGLILPAGVRADRGARRWSALLLAAVLVQMTWGALTAGLKAGHVCDTFPLWYGRWVPAGLRTSGIPWWQDLTANPVAVHYAHRCFSLVVLGTAIGLAVRSRVPWASRGGAALAVLIAAQIWLGAVVVTSHVTPWAALLHQMWGIGIFAASSAVFCASRPGSTGTGPDRRAADFCVA